MEYIYRKKRRETGERIESSFIKANNKKNILKNIENGSYQKVILKKTLIKRIFKNLYERTWIN